MLKLSNHSQDESVNIKKKPCSDPKQWVVEQGKKDFRD